MYSYMYSAECSQIGVVVNADYCTVEVYMRKQNWLSVIKKVGFLDQICIYYQMFDFVNSGLLIGVHLDMCANHYSPNLCGTFSIDYANQNKCVHYKLFLNVTI